MKSPRITITDTRLSPAFKFYIEPDKIDKVISDLEDDLNKGRVEEVELAEGEVEFEIVSLDPGIEE